MPPPPGPARLSLFVAALLAAWLAMVAPSLAEQEVPTRFFRIGTAASAETHFAAGGLVASIISKPVGSRPCEKGGNCGVPGLVAVAQTTAGAVANVQALAEGRIEAALIQADIAYAATKAVGPFKGKKPVDSLRGVAMLYPDTVHLIARRDAKITKLRDLTGKRVSLGEQGSATLADARTILEAYGLRERDLKAEFLRTTAAAAKLARGELDAFFVVDGVPAPAVAELAGHTAVTLVPIDGPPAEKLRAQFPFMIAAAIPKEAYAGLDDPVMSLDIPLVLVVRADLEEDLVYGITRALWHPSGRALLTQGRPRTGRLLLDHPTERMGVPLHNGASAYYFENGLVQ